MTLLAISILVLAAFGHTLLWIALLNRIHSLGVPRWAVEAISLPCRVAGVVLPYFVIRHYVDGQFLARGPAWPWSAYACAMAALALLGLAIELTRFAALARAPRILLSNHTRAFDLVDLLTFRPVGHWLTALLGRIPGNQVFHLHVQVKTLALPNLDPAWDGLRIAHLSDLHMSGRVDKPYFEEVVEQTNELAPHLILITGDLFDTAPCLDWIPDTLGRLRAPGGVYFILGNHDRRIDSAEARRRLVAAGLRDLGGRHDVVTWRGNSILLAGNELPWFSPAADVDGFVDRPGRLRSLRVLLSHSPDQIDWARAKGFDLMLAGHTHGGQFSIPFVGPILSPSRMGTKYAAGVFHEAPTVLHVSRGISSLTPARFNCPPELALLELRAVRRAAHEPRPAPMREELATS